MTNEETTKAHHACATKARNLVQATRNMPDAQLAVTFVFRDNKKPAYDREDPRAKQATSIASLIMSAFLNSEYTQVLKINEGPKGKHSIYSHQHGIMFVRDYHQKRDIVKGSLARMSHLISDVLKAVFSADVGFHVRELSSLRGWCYYMTKGYAHSNHIFAEGKRNVVHQHTYAPCVADDVLQNGIWKDAVARNLHTQTPEALTGVIADLIGEYLKKHPVTTLPSKDTSLADWQDVVTHVRTLDKAIKASAIWEFKKGDLWCRGELSEDEAAAVEAELHAEFRKHAARFRKQRREQELAQKREKKKKVGPRRMKGVLCASLDDYRFDEINQDQLIEAVTRANSIPGSSILKEVKAFANRNQRIRARTVKAEGKATQLKRERQAANSGRQQERSFDPSVRMQHHENERAKRARELAKLRQRATANRKDRERAERVRQIHRRAELHAATWEDDIVPAIEQRRGSVQLILDTHDLQ